MRGACRHGEMQAGWLVDLGTAAETRDVRRTIAIRREPRGEHPG